MNVQQKHETARKCTVVVNAEGQYSLWPADHNTPQGWTVVGGEVLDEDGLAYIKQVWTDMRPISLRSLPGQGLISSPRR
jgi:MbtH protein